MITLEELKNYSARVKGVSLGCSEAPLTGSDTSFFRDAVLVVLPNFSELCLGPRPFCPHGIRGGADPERHAGAAEQPRVCRLARRPGRQLAPSRG